MPVPTPYHSSERLVQAKAGQSNIATRHGQLVQNSIMTAAWPFLAAQSMVVLGSWDGQRQAWPTLIFGQPGFVSTTDGKNVQLNLGVAASDRDDPLWRNLELTGCLSILAIELGTRKRLRINGHVDAAGKPSLADQVLTLTVDQSYPNCPKYIQRRTVRMVSLSSVSGAHFSRASLSAAQSRLVAGADTVFVASVHPEQGTDVSHRGGSPGFITVESPTRLRIPDYTGNSMFNTLGNIAATGFAGLLVVDFAGRTQIQIAGSAELDWDTDIPGAERSWTLDVESVRQSPLPAEVFFEFQDASPFNPMVELPEGHAQ